MRIPNKREAIEHLINERVRDLTKAASDAHQKTIKEKEEAINALVRVDHNTKGFDEALAKGQVVRDPSGSYYSLYIAKTKKDRDRLITAVAKCKVTSEAGKKERDRVEKLAQEIAVRVALEKDYDAIMLLIAELK